MWPGLKSRAPATWARAWVAGYQRDYRDLQLECRLCAALRNPVALRCAIRSPSPSSLS